MIIKESIEVLKTIRAKKFLGTGEALSEAIKALEIQQIALEELGEKKDDSICTCEGEWQICTCSSDAKIFNDLYDIASKIIIKNTLEIEKLNQIGYELNYEIVNIKAIVENIKEFEEPLDPEYQLPPLAEEVLEAFGKMWEKITELNAKNKRLLEWVNKHPRKKVAELQEKIKKLEGKG